jgi:hypothetical protein
MNSSFSIDLCPPRFLCGALAYPCTRSFSQIDLFWMKGARASKLCGRIDKNSQLFPVPHTLRASFLWNNFFGLQLKKKFYSHFLKKRWRPQIRFQNASQWRYRKRKWYCWRIDCDKRRESVSWRPNASRRTVSKFQAIKSATVEESSLHKPFPSCKDAYRVFKVQR